MKATITADIILFVGGVFVILILMTTVFGKGIAYSILGYMAGSEPQYLQDEIRTLLVVGAYAPGDFEAGIEVKFNNTISVDNVSSGTTHLYSLINVKPKFEAFKQSPTPVAFLIDRCIVEEKTVSTEPLRPTIFFVRKYNTTPCIIAMETRGPKR